MAATVTVAAGSAVATWTLGSASISVAGSQTPEAAYMAASLFYDVDTDPIYFTVTD